MTASVPSKNIFIFSGEPSGDLHGGHLVNALRRIDPAIVIQGIAGPRMRMEGVTGPLVMEDFSVMGFTDVIRVLPKLYRYFYLIRDHILKNRPACVVLIDYPGFNLRLAKALRGKGYQGRIVRYVSPSVWAWGKHRIDLMAKSLDLLLTIYPFEKKHFKGKSLEVEYVGNPIAEYIKAHKYESNWITKLTGTVISPEHFVAIFPGSRPKEIESNLPLLLQAASLLKSKHPEMSFGISFQEESRAVLEKELKKHNTLANSTFLIPRQYTYELMKGSRCAMAKSGTVTLELALHGCPSVIFYKLSLLNRFYAKYILKLKLPHYCIVNILGEKAVFPELIESGLSTANLAHQIDNLYRDGAPRQICIEACNAIKTSLGQYDSSLCSAQLVAKAISC